MVAGRLAFLAWGVAVVNLVLPIAAHELDYRYAISAVPFACLALGLTFIRKPAASRAAAPGAASSGVASSGAAGSEAPAGAAPGVAAPAVEGSAVENAAAD